MLSIGLEMELPVFQYATWLNMSRCLGDLLGHSDAGCSAEPEVCERMVSPLDHILFVCSDGVGLPLFL